jgi:hypothetical protein
VKNAVLIESYVPISARSSGLSLSLLFSLSEQVTLFGAVLSPVGTLAVFFEVLNRLFRLL